MGIKGLTSLIQDEAPGAIQERDIKSFFGRKVALDASQALYSFLIAIRSEGQQLMNESGETTSHLMGFLYRTLRMVENGMKVCYVFDGRPPDLKSNVLKARFGKREEAREEEDEEKDVADNERIEQLARRQVRPTRTHNDEVKQLLKLMGIPCVTAPSEAEAQCAELCRAGKVYAAGSEDMDTVTFATPILLRHLTFSEAKKMPVHEVNLEKVLEGMDLTMDQFIDLCILLGCDYLEPVKGIGPKTAFKLIKDHGNIEAIREHLEEREKEKAAEAEKKGKDRPRGVVFPEVWPFEEARKIFKNPDVIKADDMELKWEHPDVEGLVKFLCTDKGFSEDRVRKGAEKLTKALGQKQQGRLDGFFKVQQAPKRKAEDEPSSSNGAKGGKGGKGSDSKASGSKKKK